MNFVKLMRKCRAGTSDRMSLGAILKYCFVFLYIWTCTILPDNASSISTKGWISQMSKLLHAVSVHLFMHLFLNQFVSSWPSHALLLLPRESLLHWTFPFQIRFDENKKIRSSCYVSVQQKNEASNELSECVYSIYTHPCTPCCSFLCCRRMRFSVNRCAPFCPTTTTSTWRGSGTMRSAARAATASFVRNLRVVPLSVSLLLFLCLSDIAPQWWKTFQQISQGLIYSKIYCSGKNRQIFTHGN